MTHKKSKLLVLLFFLSIFSLTYFGTGMQKALSTNYLHVSGDFELPDYLKKKPESIAQEHFRKTKKYKEEQQYWVDSVFAGMSLEEKVGQLFMIATYSNRTESYYAGIADQIAKYHLGGLVFFQGSAIQQAQLTNRYQALAHTPLLIGIDAEWGLGMRLDNTISFPKQITLGAINDLSLIEDMGFEIGKQCKRLGIQINFAPVADINTNPENPVINYRSFGESVTEVSDRVSAYAKGMKKAGIMACAKHFPGHGDTDTDSHVAMPIINKSKNQLLETELKPFKRLIDEKIDAVMTGHLYIPSLVSNNQPATVSKDIVMDLLRSQMHFEGLAITDALNMRGITRQYSPGGADVAAFEAGNDILLQTGNLDAAYTKLLEGFQNESLSIDQLNNSVRKILAAKYKTGLNEFKPINLQNLSADLNNSESDEIKERIFKEAVTVVRAEKTLFPFVQLDTLKIGSIAVSAPEGNDFQQILGNFGPVVNYSMPIKPGLEKDWKYIEDQAFSFDALIVSVHDMNSLSAKNFGVTPSTIEMIRRLSAKTKVIVCTFGNPYGLKLYDEFPNLICGYEEDKAAYKTVAEILFGAISSQGRLPVTASPLAKLGFGMGSPNLGRLSEDLPENVGMRSDKLAEIATIVQDGITRNAFPGCQILVARQGKVVYHKAFGTFGYGNTEKVTTNTLYDLASLTKVTATLQAVMLLNERGELDLNKRASYYVPELRGTSKEDLIIADILLHQAGLKAFIPFWANTVENGKYRSDYYQFESGNGDLQVADNLYIKPSIKDSVLKWIGESDPTTRVDKNGGYRYLYSDLGLIIMQRVVEAISSQSLDEFVGQNIYEPLGMTSTLYNPLQKFPKSTIAPTENDKIFRKSQIWGTVHDPNAALLGGVAGHAGLFSTAWDLAKLLQMNLQNGYYGGRRYLYPETIKHFTTSFSTKSNRGIGWNKPSEDTESANVASTASLSTFGHTGFTGTVAWVDPERDLIFIMLSNRVYPNASNNRLMQLQIRRKIHEVINESIDLY